MTRSMTRAIVAVVGGVLALALAGLAMAAVTPDRTLTFVDESRGFVLTMQTEPAAKDAGHFTFRVNGVGVYVGNVGAGMRALTLTSVVVNYSGGATLRPIIDANGSVTGTVSAPGAVPVTLQAQLDPSHDTAEATLRDGSSTFHMVVASRGRGDLLRAAAAFESAVASDDTTALYAVMNSDVRSRNTVAQFAQVWRSQGSQLGRITALVRSGVGDPHTDADGTTSAIVTYGATLTAPTGAVTTATYDAHFILQADAWKLWYTSARER